MGESIINLIALIWLSQMIGTGPSFKSFHECLETKNLASYTDVYDISQYFLVTYFIKNRGSHSVFVQIEISPDGENWYEDSVLKRVQPGENEIIVLSSFLKYTRLKYISQGKSIIDVWIQMQSR